MGEIEMGGVHAVGYQSEPQTQTEDTAGCDSLPLGEGDSNRGEGCRAVDRERDSGIKQDIRD